MGAKIRAEGARKRAAEAAREADRRSHRGQSGNVSKEDMAGCGSNAAAIVEHPGRRADPIRSSSMQLDACRARPVFHLPEQDKAPAGEAGAVCWVFGCDPVDDHLAIRVRVFSCDPGR